MKKVWATGAGSARPVVSTRIASKLPRRFKRFSTVRIRSRDGATDAAVVHLEHFLVGVDEQLRVDADLAELVDDHGIALAVVLGEDAVEERGLAGAEEAGEHGHRNAGRRGGGRGAADGEAVADIASFLQAIRGAGRRGRPGGNVALT